MNFKDRARQHTAGCEVIANRTKIETDKVIALYPEGVTVSDFDFLKSKKGGQYVVIAFSEDPKSYFNGGKILTEMFEDIISEFPDIQTARDEYAIAPEEQKVKLKLSHARSNSTGNKYTKVEILD